MIDAYCSQRSHLDHITPILDALPDELRGDVYGNRQMYRGYRDLVRPGPIPKSGHPLLIAGATDLTEAKRPKVLIAHGAEQTYIGADSHPEYCGGPGRELVDLFIGPRPESVARDLARYPRARGVAVGCPKLDAWATVSKPRNDRPVVAVAFHWPCLIVPEAGTAFRHFRDVLPDLARRYEVLGHAHPRAVEMTTATYRAAGIELVHDPLELLARADLLVADNTSLMYEWAALDRPVVALNAPEWRRDVEHGLRFWSHIPGASIWQPDALADTVHLMLAHGDSAGERRRRALVTGYVYGGAPDGHASERAACAVLDLVGVPCSTP